jgi:hypothetical protein
MRYDVGLAGSAVRSVPEACVSEVPICWRNGVASAPAAREHQ